MRIEGFDHSLPCLLDPEGQPAFDMTMGWGTLTMYKTILDYSEGRLYFFVNDDVLSTVTQKL